MKAPILDPALPAEATVAVEGEEEAKVMDKDNKELLVAGNSIPAGKIL
jgi:hypothetical protein